MSVPQRALIVGVTHQGSANNAYVMTLQLRAVGAPKSWVLGVVGQSELGTTTILPAA